MKNRFMVQVSILAILFMTFGAFNAMAEEKVKMGGHLKIAHSKSAGIIGNPLEIRGWNHEFIDNTLQTLIRNSNDKIGEPEALLAESWELAPDKSHYIFKLRKGLKFHDGTVCDAQAVKWNLDNWIKAERERLDKVTSVEVLDPLTVKANISAWDAITVNDFSKDTFIISPTAFEKNGKEWADYNPVGTGPFMVVDQKRNAFVKFEKFKDYWANGEPFADQMTIYTIADPMTAMAALKSREVDAWMSVDAVSAREAMDEGKLSYQLFDAAYNVIQFNSVDSESIWSNEKMRQAIEYSIDKEGIVNAVFRGMGKAVYTCIHSAPEGSGMVPRKHDPAKAKTLVKEAGYPEGVKVKMLYNSNPQAKTTVVALQNMLKEAGIEIIPTPLEGAKYNEILFQPTAHGDLILGRLRGGAAEVLTAADENYGKGSVFFKSIAKPEGFQDTIEQAMKMDSSEKINKLIQKAEKMAYDTAMIISVAQDKFASLSQPYVKDANWFWGGAPYPNLSRAWLDK